MGLANINVRFVAIMASSQHQEAEARQFLVIVDVKTLLAARGTPKILDLAIFVPTTDDDRQNRLIYPLRMRAG